MHNAPSVTCPVGRSHLAGLLMLIVWLAGLGILFLWLLPGPASGWRWAMGAMALVLAGAWAAASWWRMPAGELAWDGRAWTWSRMADGEGRIEVALDLQRLLLLRWVGGDGVRWIWLDRTLAPSHWGDVRRAVYSRADPDALPGAKQAPETP